MQVIIPMAGFGERFRRAGYDRPKPLIEVDGRPMIHWVLDLFPGVDDPILVCNAEHLAEPAWAMEEVLRAARPGARIVPIAPHRLGPVHTIVEALDRVDLDDEVVLSVCDLNFPWDFEHFQRWVHAAEADGCVVSYRGFHPHLLHSTHYAFLRHADRWATAIQEKSAFTDDPIGHHEFCSNGVYWWRTGELMARSLEAVYADPELAIAGEHYPSQCYQPMIEAGLDVAVYEVFRYLQWGNPRDLREYEDFAADFADRVRPRPRRSAALGTLLVPMAGLGQRFADAGYATPKPLVEVCGRPMAVQACLDLPAMTSQIFVLRQDLPGLDEVSAALRDAFPRAELVVLDGPTDGQARTCVLGLEQGGAALDRPVVVGACDTGLGVDEDRHAALLEEADVLVWAMRGHPGARVHPEMYGWIDADAAGRVRRLSVKVPLDDPEHDPAVVGAFSFARGGDLLRAFERLEARDGRVRGELYMDSLLEDCLALGLDVRVFEVHRYDGWGTPDDLRTFLYWQGFFHQWPHHPYRLERDPSVPTDAVPRLAAELGWTDPPALAPRDR